MKDTDSTTGPRVLVEVPNLVGMKNGNDVIAILTSLGLKWEFGDQMIPHDAKEGLTVAKQFPEAGKKVPPGSVVVVIGYMRYAPSVVGLQLDKAVAQLEAVGLRVGSVLESDPAPTPELAGTVAYQSLPDADGAVSIKVYAPFYAPGSGTQESTVTPPSGGGGGGGLISAGCGSPGGGVVITTSVNTPCSLNLGALLLGGVDMRLETQPSHGRMEWRGGILTYTPATDYRGPDSFTMSSPKKELVNGQLVNAGRTNQVFGVVVQ